MFVSLRLTVLCIYTASPFIHSCANLPHKVTDRQAGTDAEELRLAAGTQSLIRSRNGDARCNQGKFMWHWPTQNMAHDFFFVHTEDCLDCSQWHIMKTGAQHVQLHTLFVVWQLGSVWFGQLSHVMLSSFRHWLVGQKGKKRPTYYKID